ncbi:NYN domain limkain-b1-type [Arabidopsis suecica]|uniref:NYN domain limkain-b1-type n=1 Tax=Arabidopsis suecica TaxID=45249 RepID=A0A8T1YKT6_ARASU|nr:NYN domain limkain-b1-type [Arabidopsis suecica]
MSDTDETMSVFDKYVSENSLSSAETIDPIEKYLNADACIFWDMGSYPIPNGVDPCLVLEKIKSELADIGCPVDVSIHAYGNNDTFSDGELLSKFSAAEIKIDLLPEGDKDAGIYSMLVDMFQWALKSSSTRNLIVLSKNMDNPDVLKHFASLWRWQCGLILSPTWVPEVLMEETAHNVFDQNKRNADTLADSDHPSKTRKVTEYISSSAAPNIFLDNSAETMSRLFPIPTTAREMCRKTLLFWVIEDENMPAVSEFWSKHDEITLALLKEGYRGKVTINGYVVNPKLPKEYFWDAYGDHGITIYLDPEGDESIRYNRMLLHLLYWAYMMESESNLVVLSRNQNFGQGTKFDRVRQTLEDLSIKVAVLNPESQ